RDAEAVTKRISERNSSAIFNLSDCYRTRNSGVGGRTVSSGEKYSNGRIASTDAGKRVFKNRPNSSGIGGLNSESRPKSSGVGVQRFVRHARKEAHRTKSAILEPRS